MVVVNSEPFSAVGCLGSSAESADAILALQKFLVRRFGDPISAFPVVACDSLAIGRLPYGLLRSDTVTVSLYPRCMSTGIGDIPQAHSLDICASPHLGFFHSHIL
jgi:hypothetical protein